MPSRALAHVAHERFLDALIRRIAQEESADVEVTVVSARGGHGRAVSEFVAFQRVRELDHSFPDLCMVGIDSNCAGWSEVRTTIEEQVRPPFQGTVIAACPDPHIERWYLADPDSLLQVFGHRPHVTKTKCERYLYKRELRAAALEDDGVAPLGGVEFATEIVEVMDLYRAGKTQPSFKYTVEELKRLPRAAG